LEAKVNFKGIWAKDLVSRLRQLSGAEGRLPGEPPIVSMGSTAPPMVERPLFIVDHLVSDGAQVTRPSIDPYREPVETHVYLFGGTLRLSMPIGISGLADLREEHVNEVVKACYRMGVIVDLYGLTSIPNAAVARSPYVIFPEACISGSHPIVQMVVSSDDVGNLEVERLMSRGAYIVARVPPCEDSEFFKSLWSLGFKALIIDESLDDARASTLELATAICDRAAKSVMVGGIPLRYRVSLLVASDRIRGSPDAFKLMGLGADVVLISECWKIATNYQPDLDGKVLAERLEYFILGIQKELKLLAGAAGVGSIRSSIIGNRELFRAIELEEEVRRVLGVKAAGEW